MVLYATATGKRDSSLAREEREVKASCNRKTVLARRLYTTGTARLSRVWTACGDSATCARQKFGDREVDIWIKTLDTLLVMSST